MVQHQIFRGYILRKRWLYTEILFIHKIVPLFCFPADGRNFLFRLYFHADSARKGKNVTFYLSYFLLRNTIIIIIIFIYLPSDVISQEKTATSSRSITKASKYAISLKPNTQTCRVKAIFSHLVRRQRRTERSSKSTATSPS